MEEILPVKLATRKKRFLAFVLDMIIISVVGYISGLLLENFYMKLGNYGKIVGAVVVLIYFGIFDSRICKGQSIGKKICKIKVVNRNSEYISISKSFLRSLWIFLLILLNGTSFTNSKYLPLVVILGTIMFSIGLLEIYFFIFNKKTIQTFHDLLTDTFVSSLQTQGEIEYKNNKKTIYFSSVVPLLVLSLSIGANIAAKKTYLNEFIEIINVVQEKLPVHHTVITREIKKIVTKEGISQNNYVIVNTYKNIKSDDDKELAIKIALEVFNSNFIFNENELLSIVINSGYNIGIASKNNNQRYNGTVEQWKYAIKSMEN